MRTAITLIRAVLDCVRQGAVGGHGSDSPNAFSGVHGPVPGNPIGVDHLHNPDERTSPHRHEGKSFAAVPAPDVRDHEYGSCSIAAIVHRGTDGQNRRSGLRRSEGTASSDEELQLCRDPNKYCLNPPTSRLYRVIGA